MSIGATVADSGFGIYAPGRAKRPGPTELFRSLGLPSRGEPLNHAVHEGFPVGVLEKLSEALNSPQKAVLSTLGIAPATLKRRRECGRLSRAESDRVYRLARIFQQAIQLFEGDRSLAREWLTRPEKALGGQTPMAYLETEVGAGEVEDLIGRLEHGVIA